MTGGATAGSSRSFRLDPFSLPVRFSAHMAGSPGEAAVVLDRERAVVRRPMQSGPAITLAVPVKTYSGVAVRMEAVGTEGDLRVAVELLHRDPALNLTLMVADAPEAVLADWEAWGLALALPLLVVAPDGTIERADAAESGIAAAWPKPRRRHGFFKGRRSRFLRRRKPGYFTAIERVSGREIIARN